MYIFRFQEFFYFQIKIDPDIFCTILAKTIYHATVLEADAMRYTQMDCVYWHQYWFYTTIANCNLHLNIITFQLHFGNQMNYQSIFYEHFLDIVVQVQ